MNEMSFLLPHFLKEGAAARRLLHARLQPGLDQPRRLLVDRGAHRRGELVGLHVALTPTWSETAFFADYVLPMGHGSERHDLHSYEQYDGQWIGFRQPVLRAARERLGEPVADTREVNPGEVWEENEFWIELSWRIDPDGALGIRRYFESRERPGEKLTVDEYYRWIFEHSVPGLPERAAAEEGLTPLEYMRRYGAFEIARGVGALHEEPVPRDELDDARVDGTGASTRAPRSRRRRTSCPSRRPTPTPRAAGRSASRSTARCARLPDARAGGSSSTPRTLADWGWPEYAVPTYIRSHVHPEPLEPARWC